MTRLLVALGVLLVAGLVVTGLAGHAAVAPATDATGADVAPAALVAPAPAAADGAAPSGPEPDARWVERVSAATGIPLPAVRAYARASLRLAAEQPGCHLGWTTLAGIGRVETNHGRFGGRTLGDDGVPSAPIAGPELDGESYAAIREGDGWATAAGPMQFIPSTWRSWAADGDGDGRADVHDLDDAALAAGRYLCADSHDLSTGAGWTAAVLSYNHSQPYVTLVHDGAETYGLQTR